jgi:hypothetical protein
MAYDFITKEPSMTATSSWKAKTHQGHVLLIKQNRKSHPQLNKHIHCGADYA